MNAIDIVYIKMGKGVSFEDAKTLAVLDYPEARQEILSLSKETFDSIMKMRGTFLDIAKKNRKENIYSGCFDDIGYDKVSYQYHYEQKARKEK